MCYCALFRVVLVQINWEFNVKTTLYKAPELHLADLFYYMSVNDAFFNALNNNMYVLYIRIAHK